jgi:Glyoxalase-like domain
MRAAVDHLVYGSPDLDLGIAEIARLTGVRPSYGGQHVGLGTHNALASLGGRTYLEVIAPDPAQPAPGVKLPFGIGALGAPSLRAWAAAPGDLDSAVRRGRAAGVDYRDVTSQARQLPDGRQARWRLSTRASEADGVEVLPFLIDWGTGVHPSDDAPAGLRLRELRITAPDPGGVEARLRAVGIQLAVHEATDPEIEAVVVAPDGREVVLRS